MATINDTDLLAVGRGAATFKATFKDVKDNLPHTASATTTTEGVVRLADAAAITAGTAGRVVDAAQLKANAPADATTTTKGVAQLADAAAITAGTAGRVVDAAQLKAAVPVIADASETVKGIVELATAAETTAGTANTVAVHPAGLKAELDKKVNKAGDTMTGQLKLAGNPVADADAARKKYVDDQDALAVAKAGDTMTGALVLPAAAPTADAEAANKKYVDDQVAAAVGPWSRTGTTLSPKTAGDDVDLGTGDISAAGGTFTGLAKSAGLESSANVLIGGTLPATPNISLNADGSATFAGDVQVGGGSPNILLTKQGIIACDRIYVGMPVNNNRLINSTSVGTSSDSLFIGNAQIQVSSDRRLKQNIKPTALDALAAIQKIEVKDFTWNDPNDIAINNRNARGVWTGLIAQELVEILPFAVNAPRREDDLSIDHESKSTWTVDQSQLCPVLIKALQQTLTRIEALEAEVHALKGGA